MKTEERIDQEMAQLELQIADLQERIDHEADYDKRQMLDTELIIAVAGLKTLDWVCEDVPAIVATSALQYTCGGCLVAHLVESRWPQGRWDIVCPSCGHENHVVVG